MSKKINIPKPVLYPPDDMLNPINHYPNFKYILLWMLTKNDVCQWTHFTEIIPPSTLSAYIRFLSDNAYIEKFKVGYIITKKGREYFDDLSNYNVKVNKSPRRLMEQAKILERLDQISAQHVEKFTSVEDSLNAVREFLESIESFQVLVDVFRAQYEREEMESSEIVRTALALYLLQVHGYEGRELILEVLEKEKSTCFYFHVFELLNTAGVGPERFRDQFLASLEQHYGILRDELGFFLDFDYMRYVEYKSREHRSNTLLHELMDEKGKNPWFARHERIIHSEYINISNPVKREQSPSNFIQITFTNGMLSPLKSLGLSGRLEFFDLSIEHYEEAYLRELPRSFFLTLHRIEQLSLADFDFSEFRFFDNLRGFSSLKVFGLHDIKFKRIPKSLSFLPSLERISFHNQVDVLPSWVAQFACQEKFYRKYVERGVHPDDAPVLSLLEHLWGVELERYDPNFRGGDPQYSPTYDFNEDGHVTFIMKAGEHEALRTFPPQLCTLAYLDILYLGYEEIEYIPDCVKNMTNLKKISLGGNPIKRIPDIRSLPDAWLKHLSNIVPELVKQQKTAQ